MPYKTTTATANAKTEWKVINVPFKNLRTVYTDKETNRTSFGFQVADDQNIVFYASAKLVRVNSDHSGFRVSLPEGEINLTKSHKEGDSWVKEKMIAEKVSDLGYLIEE